MTPKIAIAASTLVNIILAACLVFTMLSTKSECSTKQLTLAEAKERDTSTDFDLIHDLFAYVQDYLGKNVTLTGYYSNSHMDASGEISETLESNTLYHFLTVLDEPGDCLYTIEFIPDENFSCKAGSLICVSGEFSQYEENGATYGTLKDASVQVISEPETDTASSETKTSTSTSLSESAAEAEPEHTTETE